MRHSLTLISAITASLVLPSAGLSQDNPRLLEPAFVVNEVEQPRVDGDSATILMGFEYNDGFRIGTDRVDNDVEEDGRLSMALSGGLTFRDVRVRDVFLVSDGVVVGDECAGTESSFSCRLGGLDLDDLVIVTGDVPEPSFETFEISLDIEGVPSIGEIVEIINSDLRLFASAGIPLGEEPVGGEVFPLHVSARALHLREAPFYEHFDEVTFTVNLTGENAQVAGPVMFARQEGPLNDSEAEVVEAPDCQPGGSVCTLRAEMLDEDNPMLFVIPVLVCEPAVRADVSVSATATAEDRPPITMMATAASSASVSEGCMLGDELVNITANHGEEIIETEPGGSVLIGDFTLRSRSALELDAAQWSLGTSNAPGEMLEETPPENGLERLHIVLDANNDGVIGAEEPVIGAWDMGQTMDAPRINTPLTGLMLLPGQEARVLISVQVADRFGATLDSGALVPRSSGGGQSPFPWVGLMLLMGAVAALRLGERKPTRLVAVFALAAVLVTGCGDEPQDDAVPVPEAQLFQVNLHGLSATANGESVELLEGSAPTAPFEAAP